MVGQNFHPSFNDGHKLDLIAANGSALWPSRDIDCNPSIMLTFIGNANVMSIVVFMARACKVCDGYTRAQPVVIKCNTGVNHRAPYPTPMMAVLCQSIRDFNGPFSCSGINVCMHTSLRPTIRPLEIAFTNRGRCCKCLSYHSTNLRNIQKAVGSLSTLARKQIFCTTQL
jgi:hypothetical protein